MSQIHHSLKRISLLTLSVAAILTALVFSAGASQYGTLLTDEVRLRKQPNTDCTVLDVLETGDRVQILDTSTEGWLKVTYTDEDNEIYVGYISADLVDVGVETSDTAAVNNAGVTQTATISGGGVRLRRDASTEASILTMIEDGQVVTILDDSIEGWIKVYYPCGDDSYVGFIASEYLYTNPMATGITVHSAVILREEPSNASAILAILASDTSVDILDTLDDWYKITCGDQTGYVRKDLISTEDDSGAIGYGTVTADSLTLRSDTSTDADALTGLPQGVTFQITSDETDGWYGAIFNGKSGYVSADYVDFSENVSSGYIQVTASSLTMRAGAGTAFAKLTTIPEGTVLTVNGTYGSWYQVTYNGYTGYVSGAYVSATTSVGYQFYPDFAKITASTLSLREEPSTDAGTLALIDADIIVAVQTKVGDWYKVTYDGKVGYIGAAYTEASNGPATVIVHEAPAASSSSSGSSSSSSSGSSSSSSSGNRKSASSGSSSSYEGGTTVSGGTGAAVASYAQQFYGNPYVWGGTSLTNGCDCSGFVMKVYEHFGYSLPHSSSAIRNYGKSVSYSNIQPGDIVCYSHHVGIYVGGGKIISALGRNYGITYSSATYKSIITIRRIFS